MRVGQVVIYRGNMEPHEGGRAQGSHQAEIAVPGTCPGKRPDVTRIKTTHTPCQTAGRMDGWRKDRGAIKKKKTEKRI